MSGAFGVEEFLTHLEKERDVSRNTLVAYRRDLEELVEFLGSYYGVRAWSWQGLDRLAIRGLGKGLYPAGYLQKERNSWR